VTPQDFQEIVTALNAAPGTLYERLGKLENADPVLDYRPYPDRFTIREVVAHLADFEPVLLDRISRTIVDVETVFTRRDPGQLALDNDYAGSNITYTLATFKAGRAKILALLRTLGDNDWNKITKLPPPSGPLSIETQATNLVNHDSYHTAQVTEWLLLYS
jgi:uncharacterized damage-inducible protein DinB